MANFCLHCGTSLKSLPNSGKEIPNEIDSSQTNETVTEALRRLMPTSYVEKLLATKGKIEGERRVVTILFSDVKGSTSLAENLDPEEVLEIMNGAFDVLIEPIARYEGTLARLMGDAILAFFGAPIAHEDDPDRACRAALDILQGARTFSQKLESEKGIKGFSVRVGINTGLVVVAEVGADLRVEYTAMGDAVNVAARMESSAESGTILITEATKKLISNDFEIAPVGPIQVKGKTKPINTYNVIGLTEKSNQLEQSNLKTPLIGREVELRQIQEAFNKLQQGEGKIISITGDQGIGKSLLVNESLKFQLSDIKRVEGGALSYTSKNSYWVARSILKDYLGFHQDSSDEKMSDILRNMVDTCNEEEFSEIYPFLLHFLNLPLEEKYLKSEVWNNAELLKNQIHYAVKNFIKNEAIKQPLVLICEDLHWSDSPSLELLNELFSLIEEVPILLILVYRIDENEGKIWNFHYNNLQAYKNIHEIISLHALKHNECALLINNLFGTQKLPTEIQDQMINRTEGNPFFIKELLHSLIDRGLLKCEDEQISPVSIEREFQVPELLQSIIMARIDCLAPSEKLTLQTASVIGRIFQKRLLARIMESSISNIEFEKSLNELQLSEFILRHLQTNIASVKTGFEKEYIMKDNLVQDVVYSTILLSQRQRLHRQVGEVIESEYSKQNEEFVEILADHFEKGKVLDKSIFYYRKAADRSKYIFANEEAIYFYLKILKLSEEAHNDPLDLVEVHESLGEVYALIAKYSLAIDQYNESLKYYKDTAAIARICHKCGQVYERWGKYNKALELFNDGLRLLKGNSESLQASQIYAGMGMVHYRQGNYTDAKILSIRALKILEKEGNESEIADTYNNLGIIYCKMGDLAKSLEYHKKCLGLREASGHMSGLAASNNNLGYLYQLQNNLEEAIEYYNRSIELCKKIGNLHGLARTYDNLSQLYNSQGKEELAIDYNLKAITIFAKIAKEGLEMNSEVLRQSGVW
ncbi:MAG: tetratricopeptide repeat protein [Ignavibacteriaceae bacterium]